MIRTYENRWESFFHTIDLGEYDIQYLKRSNSFLVSLNERSSDEINSSKKLTKTIDYIYENGVLKNNEI